MQPMTVKDVESLLSGLTPEQRQAAEHVDGPLLIIAGAGSGKTRVITRRVAYLIAQGIVPASILSITFTNKAAGEMKQRISAVLARPLRDFGQLAQPWPMVCTFHSLCLRILRHYAERVGLPPNFSIYDSADQTKLIKEALKLLGKSSTNLTPSGYHSAISNAKNKLLTPEQYAASRSDFRGKEVAPVYAKYQALLTRNNALDFDDLLLRTASALRDHQDILGELQERFGYILIDEYQDTNHAQYVLAHAMAMKYRNLCVVGDPDQSIYAWRGADIQNILDFEQDYPDAKVVRLERNYRSTKTILAIASQLIACNRHRKKKDLWTENVQGDAAEVYLCQDEHDEALVITHRMKELHEKQQHPWSDMAIFYRINALSRVMEDALRRTGVPYQIARGVEFYNRKEIKDVLAYLRVISNPEDEVSLERIVNVPPRGLGDSGIRQMQTYAVGHGLTLFDAMRQAAQISGLSTRAIKGAQSFVTLLHDWTKLAGVAAAAQGSDPLAVEQPLHRAGPVGRVQAIMENVVRRSGLEELYKKARQADKESAELDNVNELISSAAEFDRDNPNGTLTDYLAAVSLVSDADHLKGGGGAVTLMTLHSAKGLEFPVVAMIGLEEGVLPHSRAREDPAQLEEERRLCFVGITRAQQRLLLSKSQYRTIRGMRERTISSPFLGELPPESLKIFDRTALSDLESLRSPHRFSGGAGCHSDEAGELTPVPWFRSGQLVRHPSFGLGRIVEISDGGQHARAVVDFNAAGRKTLVLQHARLQAMSG